MFQRVADYEIFFSTLAARRADPWNDFGRHVGLIEGRRCRVGRRWIIWAADNEIRSTDDGEVLDLETAESRAVRIIEDAVPTDYDVQWGLGWQRQHAGIDAFGRTTIGQRVPNKQRAGLVGVERQAQRKVGVGHNFVR